MATSIQAALVAAGLAQEGQIETQTGKAGPRKDRRRPGANRKAPKRKFGRSAIKRSLTWEHDAFGKMEISTNFDLGNNYQDGPNIWARILFRGKPKSVDFYFVDELEPGVRVLFINNGEVTEMDKLQDFPEFSVPVRYDGPNGLPRTHAKTGDDRNIVFIRPDGAFVNLEVSVVIRGDVPCLCLQETYGGQIVDADLEDAKATPGLDYLELYGKAVTVVPLYSENAYPDQDNPDMFRNFLKVLPGAEEVVRYAHRHGAFIPFEECEPASWQPQWPELTEQQIERNWKGGVVTFFNLVFGWGFVLCEDGKACFVHFNNIIDEGGRPIWTKGEFPSLLPMAGVLLKYKDEGPRRKATSVRVA